MPNIGSPRVSVAMATYNGAAYVAEQIRSIMEQSVSVHELIVTDDCSSDDTVKIIQDFDDPRIKLHVNPEPLGVLRNFERAISLSTGDFIALADQDDVWVLEKIKILLENIGNHSLIYTDAEIIDRDGALVGRRLSARNPLVGTDSDSAKLDHILAFGSFAWGATMMMPRTTALAAMPFQKNPRNHDWWLCVVAASIGTIRYLSTPTILYRIHGGNHSIENKMPLWKTIMRFMSEDRRNRRERFSVGQYRCAELYIATINNPKGAGDRSRILSYSRRVMEKSNRISVFIDTVRYSRYLYPSYTMAHRFALSASKIFGF